MVLDADFEQNEHLGDEEIQEEQEFDAITCMFAIHYFFEQEGMIKTFLQNVANNLKPGEVTAYASAMTMALSSRCSNCDSLIMPKHAGCSGSHQQV